LTDWLVILFVATMIANVVALVRHYMIMRLLMMSLNSFVEQKRMINEFIEQEKAKRDL
jgi:hypothetical protein